MGKGKKAKGKKKRDDKKSNNDTGRTSTLQITQEQHNRAVAAAANRTEDPLKNWTRPRNDECPICMMPMPIHPNETIHCATCGKTVCTGCKIGSGIAHIRNGGDAKTAMEKAATCPYCRTNCARTTSFYDYKSQLEKEMKRADAGNGEAMRRVGEYYFKGEMTLQQDKEEGLKWFHRAVEAGSGRAAMYIGDCYWEGDGVDKDCDKALGYFQKAAELGYIFAFQIVGMILMNEGDIEEAMLNYRKAVLCGVCDDCLFSALRDGFQNGYITKEEYAYTLRENQVACNEMKTEERDAWKFKFSEWNSGGSPTW